MNAALIERLGGLAYYDDVADITWLTDANSWAAGLSIAGIDGWRLTDKGAPCIGYNCTNSEMGNTGGSLYKQYGPFYQCAKQLLLASIWLGC